MKPTGYGAGHAEPVDPARSRIMSRVRSSGNRTTELRFRGALVARRIGGWKLGHLRFPGSPDIVFPAHKLAIFLDGCFWHGCRCKSIPRAHRGYWIAKIDRNRHRDRRTSASLRRQGWRVLRLWEHELRADLADCVQRVIVTAGT